MFISLKWFFGLLASVFDKAISWKKFKVKVKIEIRSRIEIFFISFYSMAFYLLYLIFLNIE